MLQKEAKAKALEIAKAVNQPFSIGYMAKALDVTWSTARYLLLELVLEGQLDLMRTTRSMIFKERSQVGQ